MASLHWADYLVFAICLAISIGIGVYHGFTGGRQRTTEEFFTGDRKLQVIPTMLSLLVSFQSAILILGMSAEMFIYGLPQWPLQLIGFAVSLIIVERVVVSWLYPMKLTSVFVYLENRFESTLVRGSNAVLGILCQCFYMGSAMFAPAIALEMATGVSMNLTIPLMAIVCTLYTSMGGMKAVIWTDVFQFVVMMGGTLVVLIGGLVKVGGFGAVFNISGQYGRLNAIDFSPDPRTRSTFWGFLFGYSWSWVYWYGVNQASVQRYCSIPTLRQAKLVLLLNIPLVCIMISLTALTGLVMVAFFASERCDPLASKQVNNSNQMLVVMVQELFKNLPGMSGLFFAALFCGTLSSVSSSLSGAAANTWEDLLKQKLERKFTEPQAALLNKGLVVFYGLVATGLGFLNGKLAGPVTQVAYMLFGATTGPVTGVFFLGGVSKYCNRVGALVGMAVGFAVNVWQSVGSAMVKPLFETLPQIPTDGCYSNTTTTLVDIYTNHTTLGVGYVVETATMLPNVSSTPQPIPPLHIFYQISYVWNVFLGTIVTVGTGFIVSAVSYAFGAERRKVADSLVVNFWSIFDFKCADIPYGIKDASDTKTRAEIDRPLVAIDGKAVEITRC